MDRNFEIRVAGADSRALPAGTYTYPAVFRKRGGCRFGRSDDSASGRIRRGTRGTYGGEEFEECNGICRDHIELEWSIRPVGDRCPKFACFNGFYRYGSEGNEHRVRRSPGLDRCKNTAAAGDVKTGSRQYATFAAGEIYVFKRDVAAHFLTIYFRHRTRRRIKTNEKKSIRSSGCGNCNRTMHEGHVYLAHKTYSGCV